MRRRTVLFAIPASFVAGCVSVFPKAAPVQLYRFGGSAAPASHSDRTFTVELLPISFVPSAAGDLILTTTGDEAAYIKGARWVSTASSLFDQALANAFDADSGPARLMSRGEPVSPDLYLKLDIRRFEARYSDGRNAAPTIDVSLDALLSVPASRVVSAERHFSATVRADDNRGGAIAGAFDQAVASVLQSLVGWVDHKGST